MMNKKLLKKLKSIILISALGLLVAYFGLNVMNTYNAWTINYWANTYIQGINSTNIDPTLKAAQIFAINYTAQQLLQTSLLLSLPITLPQFIGIELVLAGLYFTLDYISKQYNDE